MPSAWSALGSQGQSAYVRGGVDPTDSKDGHSVCESPAILTAPDYMSLECLGVFFWTSSRSVCGLCTFVHRYGYRWIAYMPRWQGGPIYDQAHDRNCLPRWNHSCQSYNGFRRSDGQDPV
jgi:hypothetical protein